MRFFEKLNGAKRSSNFLTPIILTKFERLFMYRDYESDR